MYHNAYLSLSPYHSTRVPWGENDISLHLAIIALPLQKFACLPWRSFGTAWQFCFPSILPWLTIVTPRQEPWKPTLLGNLVHCITYAQPGTVFIIIAIIFFIMSRTWRVLKADVAHDDLTSMGEWTRWLIVSQTNTLIISRRTQWNRSLTTNLYLS